MGLQYAKRTQTGLSERQHALLTACAQDINESLGTLIREIIERNLVKELE
jgi:hypothetical protein